jgi:uncharacterized protein (TIGR02246 family)
MKRATWLLIVLALLLLSAPAWAEDDRAALDELVREWTRALNAEDIDAFLDCYWDDAIRIAYFPGSEPEVTEGKAELRAAEEAAFAQYDYQSMNLRYDEPVRFFPRLGNPTYVMPNTEIGFMDVFEFEYRRGGYRIIRQYLLPHPPAE